MAKQFSGSKFKLLIPVLAGLALLFIPQIGDFHIESAVLASLIGCFWGGLKACKNKKLSDDFYIALGIAGYLYLAALPLFIFSLLTNCFSINGLEFWLLFPLPSVFFGYSIGRLLRNWEVPFRRLFAVLILLLIGFGILGYEFFNYPQVYFFNHVWGGWPGPIYDESVKVKGATFFFRIITVLWSVLLWHIPIIRKKYSLWIIVFSAITIAFSYTQLTKWGILTPPQYLQSVLGGHKQSRHFDIYYDKQFYDTQEINILAKEHEFYFQQIADRLQLADYDTSRKIESYLYANPWQKKRLVGAKFTSYVPVWLSQDQLHIAKPQIAGSLEHELVHVMAKRFGNSLIHASWSTGLVEGLAVALSGGESQESTIDQIVASEKPYPTAEQLQHSFSLFGFYGGRSGVNYSTSGSFVIFLLKNYPVKLFKKAYKKGSISSTYPDSWQTMTQRWHRHLDSVQVDSTDKKTAEQIFGMRSLFEKKCPHVATYFDTYWDHYHYYQAIHDSSRALDWLDKAVAKADSLVPVKTEWCYQQLKAGHFQKVQKAATFKDSTVDLALLYADAFAMAGQWEKAKPFIKRAQKLFARNPDSLRVPALKTREDSTQWNIYMQMTYNDILPDSSAFAKGYYRTKIRSLRKAIDEEQWRTMEGYAQQLITLPARQRYFDDYQKLIHQLIFQKKFKLSEEWIAKISALSLRQRYRQRMQQEKEWMEFIKAGKPGLFMKVM